ncbi:MAG: hypothetical protein GY929_13635 [Actinomycetia bacterium]|nr:hypothetical protein [Actinomycetes bacterium]
MDVEECPFAAGHDEVPPRVAGRDTAFAEVEQLVTDLVGESPAETAVLASPRGGGRTAVLREISGRPPRGWRFVSVGGSGLEAGGSAVVALDAIISTLQVVDPDAPALRLAVAALDSERSAILAGTGSALASVVASLALAVAVSGDGILLALDDLASDDDSAFHSVVEGLGAGSGRGFPLAVVVTTVADPALIRSGNVIELAPLSADDLEDAVRLPAAARGRPVTNDALEAIAIHSEGHPWLVQALVAAAWTDPGEPITGTMVHQRVPLAQAAYRSAIVDPTLAAIGPGALRYLRAVATADVVTHTAVAQGLGDSNRFGGGSGSTLADTRDELRRLGLLRSPDGDALVLPLPGQRLRLLADT